MRPEFKGNLTQAAIHQLYEKQEARGKKKKQQKERGGSYNQKSTKGETCVNCGAKPVHPRSQWPATQSGKQIYKVSCVTDSKDYMILGRQ